jgi:hypothetical protein
MGSSSIGGRAFQPIFAGADGLKLYSAEGITNSAQSIERGATARDQTRLLTHTLE